MILLQVEKQTAEQIKYAESHQLPSLMQILYFMDKKAMQNHCLFSRDNWIIFLRSQENKNTGI